MTIARLLAGLDRFVGPTPMDPVAQDEGVLQWAVDVLPDRIEDVKLLDGYFHGDHRVAFATRHWKSQFGNLIKTLNANYCARVVDSLVDRLRLSEIAVYRDGGPDPDATQVLIDAFRDNRFDRRAGQMHALSARHGESYLLVWPHPDTGRPAYYPHTKDRMVVHFDPERPGEIDYAAKVWMEERRCRATVYYPDRIERWATRATYSGIPVNARGFEPYDEDDEGAVYANPYGRVPIIPFLNNTTDGTQGRSELVDVINLQDQLNKAIADMMIAMEFAGFPQRWATGLLADEKDPITGQPIYPFTAGVERLFTSDSPETSFGQFQAADLAQFIAVEDSIRSGVAQVSGTPLHYLLLTGNFPSGEALHVADAPMRAKVADRQDDHGTSWEDVALLTLLIDGTATPDSIDRYTAEAMWTDTSPHGAETRAAYAMSLRDLGLPEAEQWRVLGYDAAQIEQLRQERDEEGAERQTSPNPEDAEREGLADTLRAALGGGGAPDDTRAGPAD